MDSTRIPDGFLSARARASRPVPSRPEELLGDPQNEPLRPTDVHPRISTGRESASEYSAYLNSPQWRLQRNRALERAKYRCSRCDSKRRLQVHHLTYARLGKEWDQDLEVLCETCHQDEHLFSPDQTGLGVYLRLASEAVKADPFGDISDVAEAVKVQCARLNIPPKASRINDALAVCGLRLKPRRPVSTESQWVEPRPLSHQDARELLCRLGVAQGGAPTLLAGMIHTMPALEKSAAEQREHESRIADQIDQFKEPASGRWWRP